MSYIREVADLVLASSSDPAILNPTDFVIIAEWEKQEIPFSVIAETINGSKSNSVGEIQDKVKQNFISWLQAKDDRQNH